jgi:hypothetical protein
MGRIVVLNEMLQQGKVPKDIKAKADKGRSLYRAGKHEEALEELTKAADDVGITLKPDFDLAARSENGRRGDDPLAREIARKMRRDLVPGNHFGDPPEVVHYAESAGHPDGFSLGDWAPAAVQGPVGKRDGAPVITVEVWAYPDSGAFRDGVQLVDEQCKALKGLAATDAKLARRVNPKRCKDLQAYADALIELFLEP